MWVWDNVKSSIFSEKVTKSPQNKSSELSLYYEITDTVNGRNEQPYTAKAAHHGHIQHSRWLTAGALQRCLYAAMHTNMLFPLPLSGGRLMRKVDRCEDAGTLCCYWPGRSCLVAPVSSSKAESWPALHLHLLQLQEGKLKASACSLGCWSCASSLSAPGSGSAA